MLVCEMQFTYRQKYTVSFFFCFACGFNALLNVYLNAFLFLCRFSFSSLREEERQIER